MKLRSILFILCIMTLLSTIIGVFSYYSSFKSRSLQEFEIHASAHTKNLKNITANIIEGNIKAVKVLSAITKLKQPLMSPDKKSLGQADLMLDHINASLGADVCYIMNSNGTVLASSNRDDPDSFTGKNYAFRPYFKKSMDGEYMVYMAKGVTSGKRGIYYSHPVYLDDQKHPAGVLVVKDTIDKIEKIFMPKDHYFQNIPDVQNISGISAVISGNHDIVFVSDNDELLYKLLWKIPEKDIKWLSDSRQFGEGPWDWAGFTLDSNNRVWDRSGNEYHMVREAVANLPGWHIVHLANLTAISRNINSLFLNRIGYVVLSLVATVFLFLAILYQMARSDIAKRLDAEKRLTASESKYRLLFTNATDAIYLVSRDSGRIIDANQSACRLIRTTHDELIGLNFSDIDNSFTKQEFLNLWKNKAEGDAHIFETSHRRRDGSFFPVEMNAMFFKNNHQLYFYGIARDITERKAIEKLNEDLRRARKLEAVGTLAGGIAHDFNNLLYIIHGNCEFLIEDAQEKERDILQDIIDAARKGANLVRHLLAFSRRAELNLEPTNLNNRVLNIKKALARKLPTMVDIQLDLAQNLKPVLADSDQFEQVITNLCLNSRDAMPQGGTIEIRTRNIIIKEEYPEEPTMKKGKYVLLTVSDTGTGMAQEVIDRIFDPFFTTKGVGGGTGLGLSVIYGILKAHNGYIFCYSRVNEGTIFKIYLPAYK
ncbi:MAG: PAS domain S-box protein [Desulfamplus sp.]|nr:PAS domain S-box protein [Desulfamplus sp.]